MIDDILEAIVRQYGPLSSETLDDIKQVAQIRDVPKGAILVREGEYSYEQYYIAKGGAVA